MIRECLQKVAERRDLSPEEARGLMKEVMTGEATAAQIAAVLTALKMKGETVEEITAFAEVMREACVRIHPKVAGRLLDTCGTGGDRVKTFNISTLAAFVAAGAGIPVAKHGNRSVTSRCGSADLLERLGLNLAQEPCEVVRAIEQVGVGFIFAPAFHPAMRYAVGPRREIGLRTVFNILGPLTNPAGADARLLGVYDPALTGTLASVLINTGCREAMVVHGLDGLDEVSTLGRTLIVWLRDGAASKFETTPQTFGLKPASVEEIAGTTPDESAVIAFRILNGLCGPQDPKEGIVLANAAAAIMVAGKAEGFPMGMELARESLRSGAAYMKLRGLVKATGGDLSKLEELESRYG
ncbi:MAG: anthranilate phosphoribosyltransferase [Candidatus Bathyarchaeia archaeon]